MKKIFTLLLCLCMLSGCGGNKYKELTELLDEGKYSEAVNYINQLAYEDAKNNGTIKSQSDHIKLLYGAWEYSGSRTDIETYDIEFKDNGTCQVNGEEYLWNIRNENDIYIEIEILEGASKAYLFHLSYEEATQFYRGCLSIYNKEQDSYNTIGNYRNNDHYEIIELTLDNWQDYFELDERVTYNKDAFGDTTSCTYHVVYKLKDEYMKRLNYSYNSSPIAYEFSYENGKINVSYNLEDETFELGEFEISQSYPTNTTTGQMSVNSYNSSENYYGFTLINTSPSTLTDGSQIIYNYRNNPQMTRLQGNLMLWKGLK